jgi:hypothetical protein
VAVRQDLNLVQVDWDVVKSAPQGQASKCCAGDECMARVGESTVLLPGHLPDDVPERYQGSGPTDSMLSLLHATKPTIGREQKHLGFAHAWLVCDATAINDHGVKVLLKSATFEGPPGLDLPR